MIWQELSVRVPWEYVEPVTYLFGRYGRGLSLEPSGEGLVLLRTYLPNTSRVRRARIEVGLNLIRVLHPMEDLSLTDLDGTDWETAWKAHFTLLKLGKRLVIKPSWIHYSETPEEVVIELDPGLAFGTGYHPTTRMCLESLERAVQPGVSLVDLGTGSGILSIAAARLGAASVLALDVDPTAVTAARKNFRAAGLPGTVRLARGSLPNRSSPSEGFDLAVANISAKVIQDRAPHIRDALKPGGSFVASGFLVGQEAELVECLASHGLSQVERFQTEDWVAIRFAREP